MATLLTLGCRTAQGYLFAGPLPLDEFTALLLGDGLPEELQRAVASQS